MIYGLYQSAAGMMVNEYRQGVISNNLANAETTGFKRDMAVFVERDPAALAGVRRGSSSELLRSLTGGTWLGKTETDFRPAGLLRSENPTDVALDGEGFFLVESGGKRLATRDGRMLIDEFGNLVSAADGAAVLGVGGAPIRVNPRAGAVSIDEAGRVMQNRAIVGQLGVVDFADYGALKKAGGGRFDFGRQPTQPAAVRIMSGYTEQSGVEPVKELVAMLEASRAYQFNAQLVTLQDQTIGRLISTVASR